MTKTELINKLAKEAGVTLKDARLVVDTFFSSIAEALVNDDRVELRGFGTFNVHKKNARIGRNPKTGVSVKIPAKNVPRFKPGRKLKDFVNMD